MARAPIGLKIKNQRKSVGITQAQLAERLEISASYLNLIENNKRAIGGKLLQRISIELGMEIGALDGESDRRLIMELHEATTDPLFQNMDLSHETAANLVGRHPRWARAIKMLFRTYLDQSQTIKALEERLNYAPYVDDALFRMLTNATAIKTSSEILGGASGLTEKEQERFLSVLSEESQKLAEVAEGLTAFLDNTKVQTRSVTPANEVDDFMMENMGYFPALERAAETLLSEVDFRRGGPEARLRHFLDEKFQINVKVGDESRERMQMGRRQCYFNPQTRTFEIPVHTSLPTRRYEMACLVIEQALSDAVEHEISKSEVLISEASKELAREELIDYLARALLMPYEAFLEDAIAVRYDVDILCRKYSVTFQTAAMRLVSLRREDAQGIPFALFYTNPAGHILKRMTLPNLPIPRHGDVCPLWDVYIAFQNPGRIVRQVAMFPNKEKFLFFAKAEAPDQTGFQAVRVLKATMLACDISYADQTVYGEGLNLGSAAVTTQVGLNCRLCSWMACAHREEAPVLS